MLTPWDYIFMYQDEDEIWAEVPGYADYLVSTQGRLYSFATSRILEGFEENGFVRVTMTDNRGVRNHLYLHHVVALTFFSDYQRGMHLVHMDENKKNNSLENLRVRSKGYIQLLTPRRTRYDKQRVLINETNQVFDSIFECAQHLRVDTTAIYRVLRGERSHCRGYTFSTL